MKRSTLRVLIVFVFLFSSFTIAVAYEALVGPTGVLKYDKTN